MSLDRFNYSKWDNIELSDDESDLHPNIDKDSWFRMKHRSRLEREEREDMEMKQFDKANAEDQARLSILNARINAIRSGQAGEEAELEDMDGLETEVKELSSKIAGRNAKAKEYKERRLWNIDNICKTSEERTIVSTSAASSSLKADDFAPTGLTEKTYMAQKAAEETPTEVNMPPAVPVTTAATSLPSNPAPAPVPAPAPSHAVSSSSSSSAVTSSSSSSKAPATTKPAGPIVEHSFSHTAAMSYNDYVLAHEDLLERYSEIHSLEETKEFLFKHCDVLMHEHSQSYMLLSSLEDEMNGKKQRMKLVCRQSQILSHIQELGISMSRDPRDVILPFFHRINEPFYLKNFLSAVDDFVKKIQDRAVVKRREMDREAAKSKGAAPVGPGGLDPYEVLESLPLAMQEAFESQNIAKLHEVLKAMDPAEAKACMKKCVDSGLWVANAHSDEDEGEEGEEGEEQVEA